MCAISSLTSTFAISSPDEFLYIHEAQPNIRYLTKSIFGSTVAGGLCDVLCHLKFLSSQCQDDETVDDNRL